MEGRQVRQLGAERGHGGGADLSWIVWVPLLCLLLCVSGAPCALPLPLSSLWRDLDLLVFVLSVMPSLPALHVVCVAFVVSLIRLRFLPFSDNLALFY